MSFRLPVGNVRKTQGFGENPAYYAQFKQKGHNGVDWAVPVGTPVVAMDEGTISYEGWGQNHSWMGAPAGICALINHGGSYGGYAHLSSTVVSKGQRVSKGQVIGYSGNTGAATGPHEHSEMLPLAPNFQNGYAGRIDITPYYETATQSQGVEMIADTNQATQAYKLLRPNGGATPEEIASTAGKRTWASFADGAAGEIAQRDASIRATYQQLNDLTSANGSLTAQVLSLTKERDELKKNQGGIDIETKQNVSWIVATIKKLFRVE